MKATQIHPETKPDIQLIMSWDEARRLWGVFDLHAMPESIQGMVRDALSEALKS